MKKNILAFTLVELSIVLVIISIITGSLLSIYTDKSEADKIRETEIILDKIEQALSNYLSEYGSLPCPGDASLAISNPKFGVATRNVTYMYFCDGTQPNWYWDWTFGHIDYGTVPTKELQIPDELAFDAWGRRITYGVVEDCTISNIQNIIGSNTPSVTNSNYFATDNFSNPTNCGNYTSYYGFAIKDASGAVISPANGVPYVLISHGKNGHGAYPRNGGTSRINAKVNLSADEINNGQMTAAGVDQVTLGVFVQKAPNYTVGNNYFDDIVRYKTKDQLINSARAFVSPTSISGIVPYSSNICNLATKALTPSNYCSSSSDANCTTYLQLIADQVNKLCF
ncbi:MAG: hypothetical protein ACK4OM_01100 [Alphaproteobacteria bacterium]